MKALFSTIVFVALLACSGTRKIVPATMLSEGAWTASNGTDHLLLIKDGYASYTQYDQANKRFLVTMGGPVNIDISGKNISIQLQYHSADKAQVGKLVTMQVDNGMQTVEVSMPPYEAGTLLRQENADANLAGNYRITQIMREGQMNELPLRARRTLKLLTSNYFQWIAFNLDNGEFSGTGGGTYSFKNNVYTENITFFSRDSSRVGMSLSFSDTLRGTDWIHSGKTSRGEPLYEVWSRFRE